MTDAARRSAAGARGWGPLLVLLALVSAPARSAEWLVVCDRRTHEVRAAEAADTAGLHRMAGPFPGARTAGVWIDENCPGRRCGGSGVCATEREEEQPQGSGGWVAGEVTSESLGAPSGVGSPVGRADAGPAGPAGPGSAALEPLVATIRAATEGCSYPAALAGAEHLARFDPEHPWLRANRERLGELARRQQQAEALVWQASAELSAGRLKRARELAASATDRALSCQTEAVAGLVRGIDTAINQESRARSAANRQAAAALLPGLVDLARVISGAAAGGAPLPSAVPGSGLDAAATFDLGDPCAFRYEYRNLWNVEPVCTCIGYRFDAAVHRCIAGVAHR